MTKHDDAIVAKRVVVEKDGHPIICDVSFTVKKGSVTGLIGPSGSGKTTLMRSIIGVQTTNSGSLEVLGLAAGSAVLRGRIGYVSQNSAVYPDLTVVQNLHYFATLVRAGRGEVDEVIKQVQLGRQRTQLVENLSGGQKARVSLAMALLGSPELLVLDEPTVGLDPLLRQELWGLFAELAKQGKTLIVSSHVMEEAERCDDLLLLREGTILWNDSRTRLLESTRTKSVEDAFIAMINKGKIQ